MSEVWPPLLTFSHMIDPFPASRPSISGQKNSEKDFNKLKRNMAAAETMECDLTGDAGEAGELAFVSP